MGLIFGFLILLKIIIGINLFLPLILYLLRFFRKNTKFENIFKHEPDYAIIVTAYEQTTLLPAVVDSILKLDYNNFLVYVVADKCDISDLQFGSDRVILLKPEIVLASNIKSHFYAISHFKRSHEYLTIIDSDNLVDPQYLNELNVFFANKFCAVQGVRKAKNLNTSYACLDEAGDMYYRFIDRKLLFEVGSSASLAGSGMAFNTNFYQECLGHLDIDGAGFDKVLQMEILSRGERIAFAENAVVYDEKTSKTTQLVNQRSRWINTWFKYAGKGLSLMKIGFLKSNWNQFVCGLIFSRPPLFIVVVLSGISIIIDFFFFQKLLFFWMFAIISFFTIFFVALSYFNAPKAVYAALVRIPFFIYFQIISLFKAKQANKISTATVHYYESKIDQINHTNQ